MQKVILKAMGLLFLVGEGANASSQWECVHSRTATGCEKFLPFYDKDPDLRREVDRRRKMGLPLNPVWTRTGIHSKR